MEVVRDAARVMLLDERDRVLLLCFADPSDARRLWVMPGGALEAGESFEQAALRELDEETGLRGAVLGPCIGEDDHRFAWNNRSYRQHERYFVARTSSAAPIGGAGLEQDELLVGSRWWSHGDLVSASEPFAPADLPGRLADAVRRYPPDPVGSA